MAADPTPEERNALALCVILARLLARREVGGFPQRLGVVDLALVDAFLVAFDAIRHACGHTGRGSRYAQGLVCACVRV